MGDELLGDLILSGKLNVFQSHAYPKYSQRDSHPVSRFFLAYNQAGVETKIFMELPIGFGVEGDHIIEWVIRLDRKF